MAERINVTVILPVKSADTYEQAVKLTEQGKDIQVILLNSVTGSSSDDTPEKIKKESRTEILSLECADLSKDLMKAVQAAKGTYLCFSDSAIVYPENYFREMYQKADSENADLISSGYRQVNYYGYNQEYRPLLIPMEKDVFYYQDCPQYILNAMKPVLWNKLIRKDFLIRSGVMSSLDAETYETELCVKALAFAERITYIKDLYCQASQIRVNTDTAAALQTVENVHKYISGLSYGKELSAPAARFAAENYAETFVSSCSDLNDPKTVSFYRNIHQIVQSEEYDLVNKTGNHDKTYRWLKIFRKYSYEDLYQLMKNKKLIVSLTTYPARIQILGKVLQTIYNQTRKPDEVVLWLAESQFPGKEEDLPEDLNSLIAADKLHVEWCMDVRPHKKYIFAMKKYPEDLLITVDDDLYYDPEMIEYLYLSYLEYPECVSACRTHLIAMDEEHNFLPYSEWIMECNLVLNEPCMELFATGGAGTLYPPHLFDEELLDPYLVQKLCPIADDLWLKTMEILKDIPVVQAYPFDNLWYIEDSQNEGLVHSNVDRNMNDVQLDKIRVWVNEKYGDRSLENGIVNSASSQVPYGLYRMSLRFRPIMAENERLKKEYSKLREDFDNVVNSVSFKAGRTITSLPRNIRDVFRKK